MAFFYHYSVHSNRSRGFDSHLLLDEMMSSTRLIRSLIFTTCTNENCSNTEARYQKETLPSPLTAFLSVTASPVSDKTDITTTLALVWYVEENHDDSFTKTINISSVLSLDLPLEIIHIAPATIFPYEPRQGTR